MAPAVLVTGAASGIGRATARALAATGRDLILWDIQAEPLAALAAQLAHRLDGIVRLPSIKGSFDAFADLVPLGEQMHRAVPFACVIRRPARRAVLDQLGRYFIQEA